MKIAQIINRMIRLDPKAEQLLEPLIGTRVGVRVPGMPTIVLLFTATGVEVVTADKGKNDADIVASLTAVRALMTQGHDALEQLRIEGDVGVLERLQALFVRLRPDPKASVQAGLTLFNQMIVQDNAALSRLRPLVGRRVRLRLGNLPVMVVLWTPEGLELMPDNQRVDAEISADQAALRAVLTDGRAAMDRFEFDAELKLIDQLQEFAVGSMHAVQLTAVELSNRVLNFDDQAATLLLPLQGCHVRLRLAELPPLVVKFTEQGIELAEPTDCSVAEIHTSVENLRTVLLEGEQAIENLPIQGDDEVVKALRQLLRNLNPDWAASLGDILNTVPPTTDTHSNPAAQEPAQRADNAALSQAIQAGSKQIQHSSAGIRDWLTARFKSSDKR